MFLGGRPSSSAIRLLPLKRQFSISSSSSVRFRFRRPKQLPRYVFFFVGSLTIAYAYAYGSVLYEIRARDRDRDSTPSTTSRVSIEFRSGGADTEEVRARRMSAVGQTAQSGPAVPPIGPGRPETLTKEQEVKLKELWTAVMKVTGAENGEDEVETVEQVAVGLAAATIAQERKDGGGHKKSKIGSLLQRAKKDKEKDNSLSVTATPSSTSVSNTSASGTPASVSTVNLVDEKDDKHGQVKVFKVALSSQTPAELRRYFWDMIKYDNPDALLLRFLRARKWDVEKALVMLISTLQWRDKDMKVHEIIKGGEGGPCAASDNDFMSQLRIGKSFLHGWDKHGRPICHIRVKLHKAGEASEESLERYTIYIMETARLMLNERVDTACVVFDMTDFSMANMDYAPVKFLVKCFEAHYPECLGVCLIHKAPWIFSGIWSIIKGWLDPVVAGKINFTKTQEDLERFIPKERIIKELGGPDQWEFKYQEPIPGEDKPHEDKEAVARVLAEREVMVKQYEELTRLWIREKVKEGEEESDGGLGAGIKEQRLELARTMKRHYWTMDKYVRGRTIYDRTGVISPDGVIDFYRKKEEKITVDHHDSDVD